MHQPTELRQVNWFQLDKFKLTDDLLMQKCSKQGEGFLGGKAQSTARQLIGLFFEVGMCNGLEKECHEQLANCRSETDKTPVWDEKEGT